MNSRATSRRGCSTAAAAGCAGRWRPGAAPRPCGRPAPPAAGAGPRISAFCARELRPGTPRLRTADLHACHAARPADERPPTAPSSAVAARADRAPAEGHGRSTRSRSAAAAQSAPPRVERLHASTRRQACVEEDHLDGALAQQVQASSRSRPLEVQDRDAATRAPRRSAPMTRARGRVATEPPPQRAAACPARPDSVVCFRERRRGQLGSTNL